MGWNTEPVSFSRKLQLNSPDFLPSPGREQFTLPTGVGGEEGVNTCATDVTMAQEPVSLTQKRKRTHQKSTEAWEVDWLF